MPAERNALKWLAGAGGDRDTGVAGRPAGVSL
jgi:hypothetical protein